MATKKQTERFRSAYSPPLRVHPAQGGESLTHQSFREACEVETLLSQHLRGIPIPMQTNEGRYVRVPNMDFHSAMNLVTRLRQTFDSLDATTRNEYANVESFLAERLSDIQPGTEVIDPWRLEEPSGSASRDSAKPGASSSSAQVEDRPEGSTADLGVLQDGSSEPAVSEGASAPAGER